MIRPYACLLLAMAMPVFAQNEQSTRSQELEAVRAQLRELRQELEVTRKALADRKAPDLALRTRQAPAQDSNKQAPQPHSEHAAKLQAALAEAKAKHQADLAKQRAKMEQQMQRMREQLEQQSEQMKEQMAKMREQHERSRAQAEQHREHAIQAREQAQAKHREQYAKQIEDMRRQLEQSRAQLSRMRDGQAGAGAVEAATTGRHERRCAPSRASAVQRPAAPRPSSNRPVQAETEQPTAPATDAPKSKGKIN